MHKHTNVVQEDAAKHGRRRFVLATVLATVLARSNKSVRFWLVQSTNTNNNAAKLSSLHTVGVRWDISDHDPLNKTSYLARVPDHTYLRNRTFLDMTHRWKRVFVTHFASLFCVCCVGTYNISIQEVCELCWAPFCLIKKEEVKSIIYLHSLQQSTSTY